MKSYRLYILDLDGTVYRGNQVIEGAAETIAELRSRGALVRFLTNNSGRTRSFYADKLRGMGIPCEANEFYSSALGAARYCTENGIASAFVVGEEGLFAELRAAGVEPTNEPNPAYSSVPPEAVVAGICRQFTYTWMNSALQEILGGAKFIATNTDATYPLESGRVEPGAGAVVASIRTASGIEPIVLGKPNPYLVNLILAETGVPASETLAVGDRKETDLDAGKAAGCDAFLVLSGVTASPIEGVPSGENLLALI